MPERSKRPVDVVVLSWNRLDATLETVANVLSQRGVSPSVWLVDQGSGPSCVAGLREVAGRHPCVTLLELRENIGVAGGRNRGMALGNAECIVVIDNDAEFADADALSHAVDRLDADETLGAIGFRIDNYHTGDLDRLSWVYPRSLLQRKDSPFLATRYCGAGHALRRSAVAKTRGYDESLFFFWEELDLSYQLIEAGYRVAYDPSIVVRHKVSPHHRTDWRGKRFYYMVRNALYLEWKYFRSPLRWTVLSAGYQIKGLRNGTVRQALTGIRDAVGMIRTLSTEDRPLSGYARAYIAHYDRRRRGSLLERIRTEVLERLPGS